MENIFLNLTFPTTLITLAISVFVSILLAFIVYKNNPKSASNKLFVLLSLSIIFWLVEFYISVQTNPPIFSSLIWIRLSLFFATPMTVLFFLFSHTFPNEKLKLNKKSLFIILLFNFLVMAITVSPYAFTDAKIINNFPSPIPGFGLSFFIIFIIILISETIYILIKKYINSSGVEKKQIFFIILGILFMYFFMFSTVLIPVAVFQNTTFVPLFPVYTLIFIALTTYAILKYKLFNLKVIATEFLTFGLWIVLLVRTFLAESKTDKIVGGVVFSATVVFGVMLIKSVINEVKTREELQRLYSDLKIADEKLKKVDEEKSEFIFITSHQLRTPMTVTKGYISMILEGDFGKLSGKLKEVLLKIYISNERLVKIINDLLDLSRIERGKMDYHFKKVSFAQIVKEAVAELAPAAKDKKIKIVFNSKSKLPDIYADEDYTRQVAVNLIDNAIKYSDKGEIKIEIEPNENGDKLVLSVRDKGIGISGDVLPFIFQRYTREERMFSKAIKGMGLGLYIAKKIIDGQNGRIWAESEGAGRGATFFVELSVAG